jgi:hypothetical protein
MSKLINMVMRVALWGALGGVLAIVVTWVGQNFFEGGVLGSGRDTEEMMGAGVIGAAIGGVIGFFRRN